MPDFNPAPPSKRVKYDVWYNANIDNYSNWGKEIRIYRQAKERENDTHYFTAQWLDVYGEKDKEYRWSVKCTSEKQKFLCIGGQFDKQRITLDKGKEAGYLPYNKARSGPRVVQIHESVLDSTSATTRAAGLSF